MKHLILFNSSSTDSLAAVAVITKYIKDNTVLNGQVDLKDLKGMVSGDANTYAARLVAKSYDRVWEAVADTSAIDLITTAIITAVNLTNKSITVQGNVAAYVKDDDTISVPKAASPYHDDYTVNGDSVYNSATIVSIAAHAVVVNGDLTGLPVGSTLQIKNATTGSNDITVTIASAPTFGTAQTTIPTVESLTVQAGAAGTVRFVPVENVTTFLVDSIDAYAVIGAQLSFIYDRTPIILTPNLATLKGLFNAAIVDGTDHPIINVTNSVNESLARLYWEKLYGTDAVPVLLRIIEGENAPYNINGATISTMNSIQLSLAIKAMYGNLSDGKILLGLQNLINTKQDSYIDLEAKIISYDIYGGHVTAPAAPTLAYARCSASTGNFVAGHVYQSVGSAWIVLPAKEGDLFITEDNLYMFVASLNIVELISDYIPAKEGTYPDSASISTAYTAGLNIQTAIDAGIVTLV